MRVERVTSYAQIERLRELRNECRETMTNHTYEISKAQQSEWWDSGDRIAYLFADGLGFGYLSVRGDFLYLTVGVAREARGMGLGTEIFAFFRGLALVEIAHDNEASLRAATKAGFEEVAVDGHRVVMR